MVAQATLAAESRVWIYQSNRPFTVEETAIIKKALDNFCTEWTSHSNQLKAEGEIYHNQFIVLSVDESQSGASGCSIDKSVYFMQAIEKQYNVDLFDRMNFAYKDGETVKTAYREEFMNLYKKGFINDETLVFDNLVSTRGELETDWLKPLKDSWHSKLV